MLQELQWLNGYHEMDERIHRVIMVSLVNISGCLI
jgi:hypothetical protein